MGGEFDEKIGGGLDDGLGVRGISDGGGLSIAEKFGNFKNIEYSN